MTAVRRPARMGSLSGRHSRCSVRPCNSTLRPIAEDLRQLTKDKHVKQVVAIVKPFLAEKVLAALRLAPLEALSVREVKGFGRQKSYLDQYGASEYSHTFLPKVEITMWVEDGRADEIIRKVIEASRTGRMGDGKIMVLPVMRYESVIDLGDDHDSTTNAEPKSSTELNTE